MMIEYTQVRIGGFGIIPIVKGSCIFIKKRWLSNKYYLYIYNRGILKSHKIGNFTFEEAKKYYLLIFSSMPERIHE